MKHKFKIGESVLWRGGFGRRPARPATIIGLGSENDSPVYDLDNGHWCYESQLKPMAEPFYELTPFDVGQPTIRFAGKSWPVCDFIGQILKQDIGKRVFLCGDILQVENNEQRDTRLSHENDH